MPDFDPDALLQRWTHSHEEDTPGRMVFRPVGWRFPPSRGRRSFQLARGGAMVGGRPGPTDKPEAVEGRWRLRDDGVLELDEKGRASELRVLEVGPDKLVVER
jgi:hypothetical protein